LGNGGRAGGPVATGGTVGIGGRTGTAGAGGGNCITEIQAAGYSSGGRACASCVDHAVSLASKCRLMVDCLAPSWPCSGNCWSECLNMFGDATLDTCVRGLTTAACM
jgi:hypothetical protein